MTMGYILVTIALILTVTIFIFIGELGDFLFGKPKNKTERKEK